MLTQHDVLSFLKAHLEELHQKFDIRQVGLFGSFARNEQTLNSDIDVLIELGTPSHIYEKKTGFRRYLESQLGRPVDVVRVNHINKSVRNAILNDTLYVN